MAAAQRFIYSLKAMQRELFITYTRFARADEKIVFQMYFFLPILIFSLLTSSQTCGRHYGLWLLPSWCNPKCRSWSTEERIPHDRLEQLHIHVCVHETRVFCHSCCLFVSSLISSATFVTRKPGLQYHRQCLQWISSLLCESWVGHDYDWWTPYKCSDIVTI